MRLLGSMRVQLTCWYSGVLAIVLLVFTLTIYSYLERVTRQRADDLLSDMARSFISAFNSELYEEHEPADFGARESARIFQYRDRQVIGFDEQRRVVVTSDNSALGNSWFASDEALPQMNNLLTAASTSDSAFADFFSGQNKVRALAIAVPAGRQRYTFVFANQLRDQERTIQQVRKAFFLTVPLTLLGAGLGGYFLARKSLMPVVTMGEQAASIGALNLSERIPVPARNQELGRLALIFNDLLARLDASFTQQKRFMADASHELRTPVAVICGESEVALSKALRTSEEYRESLTIVHEEGRRLTRMVEDLFTLARADAGQYPLKRADFYLDESLGDCVRSVRCLAAKKRLDLSYQPSQKEIAFSGDEALIQRMVLNLLHNAIKYTPDEGQVSLSLRDGQSHCEVIVSDTGHGIPNDAQALVFERFFRVEKARSRQEPLNGSGAGLGLAIARWAAELHGGSISLRRSDRRGTTFVISLPLEQVNA